MIDTIRLQLVNPILRMDVSRLILADRYMRDGLPITQGITMPYEDGHRVVYGSVRYGCPGLTIESRRGFLYLTVNPRRFNTGGGPNIGEMTKQGSIEIMGRVQRHLSGLVGIYTHLEHARPVRLDLSADAAVDHPYVMYKPIADGLDISRTTRMIYETGCLYKNSQRAVEIYDKREQLRVSGFPLAAVPPNYIRWEVRCLTAESVESRMGVKTLSEVYSKWDDLRGYLNAEVYQLLGLNAAVGTVQLGSIADDLRALTTVVGEREAFNELLKVYGTHLILEKAENLGNLDQILRNLGIDSATRWRYRKLLRQRLSQITQTEGVTLLSLKEELAAKLQIN